MQLHTREPQHNQRQRKPETTRRYPLSLHGSKRVQYAKRKNILIMPIGLLWMALTSRSCLQE